MLVDLRIRAEEADATRPRRSWWGGFERWAATGEESETSVAPLALILGFALVVQYAQLLLPGVGAFLEERDILYRTHWAAFTILKQWALFALVWVVLRASDIRFLEIGFPAISRPRVMGTVGVLAFSLAAAVLHRPAGPPEWMTPVDIGERVLWVGLALTAAVVEETLFRGFAVVWIYRWSGHLGLAVAVPALVFGAGHAALSLANAALALGAALGFSLLFLWRRDLYWPMLLHFLVDVLDLLR